MEEWSTRSPTAARFLFSTILLGLTLTAYFIPYYDWDLVAYIGSAIALHDHDAKSIQAQAYSALRTELSEDEYRDIANGSDFRRDVARNADHFSQQLRFYQIRPLYICLLAGIHGAGIGYVNATRLLSAGSFALIGLLLFVWARKYIDEWRAAICIPLLLIAPVLFTSARTGSPDALSAFVVLLGTFELVEHRRFALGATLLLLALFLRADDVILVALLLTGCAIRGKEICNRVIAVSLAVFSAVIVLGINHVWHSYSWPVLMMNTANPIPNPAEIRPEFGLAGYFQAMHDMLDEARESSMLVFPFVAVLSLFSSRTARILKQLVTVVLLSWATHIVLFPHIEDRYFVAGSALVGIATISALLGGSNQSAGPARHRYTGSPS
jgi:hypothetical protein